MGSSLVDTENASEIAPSPLPHPPLNTTSSCWGEKIEVTDEHASACTLVSHFNLFPQTQCGGAGEGAGGEAGERQ